MQCPRYRAAHKMAIGGGPKIKGGILSNIGSIAPPIGVIIYDIRVGVLPMKSPIEVINVACVNRVSDNGCVAKVFRINYMLDLLVVDHCGGRAPLSHLK